MAYLGNDLSTIVKSGKVAYKFLATSGQTSFTGNDANGVALELTADSFVNVFLNGVRLIKTDDYTLSYNTLTLVSGATLNDELIIVRDIDNSVFTSYTKTEADAVVNNAITNLKGGVGTALDTLNELAAALGNDANYAATITTALGTKANQSTTYTKTEVDNALSAKANTSTTVTKDSSTGAATLPVGTTAQRPGTPAAGMTRFNSDTGEPEWYDSTYSRWTTFAEHPRYTCDITVVAGGGGGGGTSNSAGGGGGAGGLVQKVFTVIPGSAITITVGAGGAQNVNGSSSSFGGFFTALGGGYGGNRYDGQDERRYGNSGGSGGGSAKNANSQGSGGNGSGGQGSNGGGAGSDGSTGGGGGGGAGRAGYMGFFTGSQEWAGDGGEGLYHARWSDINVGYPTGWLAGGGGAGVNTGVAHHNGVGGAGGGASAVDSGTPSNAVANTGGGGAGGIWQGGNGSSGGSGIVIISYPGAQRGSGGTITSAYGYTHHVFTSSGTYTA